MAQSDNGLGDGITEVFHTVDDRTDENPHEVLLVRLWPHDTRSAGMVRLQYAANQFSDGRVVCNAATTARLPLRIALMRVSRSAVVFA